MLPVEAAEVLWGYLSLSHPLQPADIIVGFGSYDKDTALRAAALYRAGWAPKLLFSGGLGKGTEGFFEKPEAELYAQLAQEHGVPGGAILIENKSANSGENIHFSKAILAQAGLQPRRMIVVHKPYMGRRAFAALQKQWPQVEALIAPSDTTCALHLEKAARQGISRNEVLSSMTGDLQRIDTYARLGYQTPQPIPKEALEAYEVLVKAGYDKYILNTTGRTKNHPAISATIF